MSKWAIMVCIDIEEDDWIFVTKQQENYDWPKPLLFDEIEDAMAYAQHFDVPGNQPNVQVVNYSYES